MSGPCRGRDQIPVHVGFVHRDIHIFTARARNIRSHGRVSTNMICLG